MTDQTHRWRHDPAKWEACGRLELLGACIGAIDDETEHIELLRRRDGSPIVDADIPGIVADVNTLVDATTLDLSETDIGDESASHLGQLRTVTALYLAGTKLTDAGVSALIAIPYLRDLVLSGTAITDRGLAALATAANLRFLQLCETSVTEQGVSRLQQALPELQIEYDD